MEERVLLDFVGTSNAAEAVFSVADEAGIMVSIVEGRKQQEEKTKSGKQTSL